MPAYAAVIPRPQRTLTEVEQATLLKVTGEHRDGFCDHVLISLALGTGLREHELLALDCGDVFDDDGRARRRVTLRVFKRSADEPAIQEVVLLLPLELADGELLGLCDGEARVIRTG